MPPGSPTVASTHFLRQAFTAGSVTKATPIHFIDSKSRLKKWRVRKTALSGYYACLSRGLLLMASGADTHTHIQQRLRTKKPGARAPGLIKFTICHIITTLCCSWRLSRISILKYVCPINNCFDDGKLSCIAPTRVESGSHLLTYLTHWPTEQSGCDPHMIHLWPTCWCFLFKSS